MSAQDHRSREELLQEIANLKESEESLRQTLDAINDLVFIKDAQSKLVWGNKAFCSYYGMSNEEIRGIFDAPFVSQAITAQYIKDDQYVLSTGKVIEVPEEPITRFDGAIAFFNTVKSPIFDTSGKVVKMVGVSRDISARKLTEGELRKSEQRYKAVFEGASDGILVAEIASMKFAYANPSLCKMFGYSEEELIHIGVMGLHPQESLAFVIEDFKAKARGEREITENVPCLKKDGSLFFADISARAITLGDKECLVGFFRDITPRKQAEAERAKLQAQLMHQEKLASIGTLAAGVAHEINNPLSIVMGYIDIVEMECNNHCGKNNQELIPIIKEASRRIATIVNGLRTYVRTDTEHVQAIDLHECINKTIHLVEEIYKKENITLKAQLLAHDYFIKGNAGKIQQVIMNMLSNAKDALRNKLDGCIQIATANDYNAQQGSVWIDIADNGSGIAKEIVEKLFDPFFTTKAPGKGTGLGLSICSTIVKSFGGTISVKSVQGVGTSFKIVFPLSEHELLATALPTPQQEVQHGLFKGKALIVDDEKDIRRLLRMLLSSLGLSVVEADNGETAYNLLKTTKEQFDYVLTDIKMPKMNGDRLITLVKEENIAPKTKFIIITGGLLDDYSCEQNELLIKNTHGYLEKPFTKQDLSLLLELLSSKIG
ncbi:MAG: PAS domain S-box protein [Oligoflexia bacterium]|nr:PAS domain S-box protein [Oligoflexia bacterium]